MVMDAILEPEFTMGGKDLSDKLMVKYLVENLGINPEK
jgi:hypothetical protein